MATRLASRLRTYFERETDGHLRSIVRYEKDDYDLEYVRDDVSVQYTNDEIEAAVDESRMESLTAPLYSDAYAEDHGDIVCLAICFENVIEMNFVLDDGIGVAVGLDVEAMAAARGLVGGARRIVIEERNGNVE